MADKIKAFFQKKKANTKFMNAGRGYKLNESSKPETSEMYQPKEPIKRAEPTEEAKVAGQAALARLKAKESDTRRFNTSYAAIQARVKKELELERKARQELEKETATKLVEKPKDQATNNEFLAVVDVYFRCPYISDEILTREEWKRKIREFLYEQLKEEEAGLTSCLIIHNCNTGKTKIQNCIETLEKYIENILNNPDVEKYQKIRMCNKIFQEKVLPLEGALEFLKAAGFEQKKLLHNDVEEDFLVWNPDGSSLDDLTMLVEAIRSAEIIPLEVDRNLQVLLPSQANEMTELPESFFNITLEELKKEQKLRAEAIERNQMLRTKAMREKDEERELRRYRFTLIRIKFPDNIILQGTFSVHDKYKEVVDFVKENLINANIPFFLLLSVGQKIRENDYDKTLLELRLIPACLLKFSYESDKGKNLDTSGGYLKESVLCLVRNA
ncbi:UBX domain-containing protein 6-like [Vespa mandarinia]|uniref:UBX domain-containing protein 6-like n=1 Tax=Vespa mandarinia TaxID=7446 RepID=UPI0016128F59|nr:UBX domain-containing protein 6-like [Vespa mandarinia]